MCVDVDGTIASVLPMKSTGFNAYDRKLLAHINAWKYSRYMINAQPVPVCTGVTFIYSQT